MVGVWIKMRHAYYTRFIAESVVLTDQAVIAVENVDRQFVDATKIRDLCGWSPQVSALEAIRSSLPGSDDR